MMKTKITISVFILAALSYNAYSQEKQVNNPTENFEKLWGEFNDRYAVFEIRGVDWQEIYRKYRPLVNDSTPDDRLFSVCCDMLSELKDRHVSLIDNKNSKTCRTGAPVKLLRDFPNNDSLKKLVNVIDSTLIKYGFGKPAQIKMDLPYLYGNVVEFTTNSRYGYLRVNLMYGVSRKKFDRALDSAIAGFKNVRGVIIDIRFNTGGYDKYAYSLAGRFTDKKRVGHYKRTRKKNGFTPLETWYLKPAGKQQVVKPIILLTSDLSMSAADVFAMAMKELPYVTIIGDHTYGIFSDMYEAKLPNGWDFTLSHQKYFSAGMKIYEGTGVPPDIRILNSRSDLKDYNDPLVVRAIEILNQKTSENPADKKAPVSDPG